MKIKLCCIFILLHTLVSCQENVIINDLKFSNYSGNLKKVTEIITFSNHNIDKSISHYDKDGFLVKIEYYNLTKSESPNERFLNKIINYNSKNKEKRYFESINPENNKIEAEGYFEKITDSLYKRVSKSNIYNISLSKLFYFDKNNKLIKTEETGNFKESKINNIITYSYNNSEKEEIVVEDMINNKKSTLFYDNIKLDHNFNSIYEELFDNGGVLQQKIEREFEYY